MEKKIITYFEIEKEVIKIDSFKLFFSIEKVIKIKFSLHLDTSELVLINSQYVFIQKWICKTYRIIQNANTLFVVELHLNKEY